MANVIVNDIQPRIQYVALQDQTVFFFPFVTFEASDLKVFLTPVGNTASDGADILQLGIDYVVEGIADSNGGNVILTNSANGGDFITILRDSPISRTTNFAPGSFSEEQMNDALNEQVTFSQDNEMFRDKLNPQYQQSDFFLPGQLVLPKLGANQVWKATADGNGLIAVDFSITNCDTLRQDLAVEAEFSCGARLVGYFDARVGGLGQTTVNLALDAAFDVIQPVSATNNIILGGDFSTNPFQEGVSFSDIDIGVARYIADGWGIQLVGTMRVSTLQDLAFPVPVALSNIFSDASLKITSAVIQAVMAADDRCVLDQPIEGYYFREIAQRTSFLTFYVRSSVTGTYCIGLVNTGSDQSFIKEYTIAVANTWEKKIIEIPPSPVAGVWGNYREERAATLVFTLAAGVNSQNTQGSWISGGNFIATANQVNFFGAPLGSTFNIALIQIEPTKGTPFQIRSQEKELAFAQRYFEKSYNQGVNPGTITRVGSGYFVNAIPGEIIYPGLAHDFAVGKRVTPFVTWYSTDSGLANFIFERIPAGSDVPVNLSPSFGFPAETNTGFPQSLSAGNVGDQLLSQYTANARMDL